MHYRFTLALLLVASPLLEASPRDVDGVWVLSGEWTGYMGLALKISGDHYKYWFSSDVAPTTYQLDIKQPDGSERISVTSPTPKYPLTGRVVVRGDTIELQGPGDYYDHKWRRITYRGVPCLLAEQHYVDWKKTGKLAEDRLLFRAQGFDEAHPRLNYGGVEQPDGSVTRTSPLPTK